MPKLKSNKGFTLVELLVVIAIIAILTVILFVSFTQVQRSTRDTQRRSDLQTVAAALQRFYSDNSHFPGASTNGEISYNSFDCGATTTDGNPWGQTSPWIANIECGGENYLRQLPADPIETNLQYCYETSNNEQNYSLFALLEVDTGDSFTCNGETYNFRIRNND